jgi:peptidoglycan/xylan/chitin deacetylase (PgdA/CDA1 family)
LSTSGKESTLDRKLYAFPPAEWHPDPSPTLQQVEQSGFPYLEQSVRSVGRFVRNSAAALLAPAVAATEWRRRRLLILGYHGISIADEHIWDGGIYMSAEVFRRRLDILRKDKCAVLPLETALHRLSEGTLPPRAVSIVFDDGFHDFASVAAPILAEFGYSATVFLSTYYAQFNRPIFDIMLSYLLWKGPRQTLVLPGIVNQPVYLSGEGQLDVRELVRAAAVARGLTGQAKDELLAEIAEALDIDYSELCRKRLLHMMNAEEVREIEALGHAVQLHTHRHRVSREKTLFAREIRDNRSWIRRTIDGAVPTILSYPGGVWQPVEQAWLTELGIQTAITCRPALADVHCDRLLLPRVVDNSHTSEQAFRGWVLGSMDLLPKGEDVPTPGQILEETNPCPIGVRH